MMRLSRLRVLLALAPGGGLAAAAEISPQLAAIAARHKVPGLAAVALRGDAIAGEAFVGVRKAGDPAPLARTDKFHLGSDTKAMTATVAARFVEEGKLSWDATLGDLLGATVGDMRAEWRGVTYRQLLTHRAGLPANPPAALRQKLHVGGAPLDAQRREIARDALVAAPEHPPGSKFLYSNTGYILAGAVLEKISGRPWEELMRARLFAPLGLTSGGFGPPGTPGKIDQPWAHTAGGTPRDPGTYPDNPAHYGPAGTAHMTMQDWAKFVALHLRGDPANPNHHATLLKAETFAALHTASPGETYAAGWGTGTRPWAKGPRPGDTGRILTHAGSNTMWHCVAWLAPEIDFAVLVACNQGGDAAAKACDEGAGVLIRAFAAAP